MFKLLALPVNTGQGNDGEILPLNMPSCRDRVGVSSPEPMLEFQGVRA